MFKNNFTIVLAALLVSVVVLALSLGVTRFYGRETVGPCVVIAKETAVIEGERRYRIHTDGCGVLLIRNSYTALKFDSEDIYSSLEIGKTYTFNIQGFRLGIKSSLPNVLSYEEH